jgi:hypothetical protein
MISLLLLPGCSSPRRVSTALATATAATVVLVALILLVLSQTSDACRPRSAASVTHGGRSLGEVDVPLGPLLQGNRFRSLVETSTVKSAVGATPSGGRVSSSSSARPALAPGPIQGPDPQSSSSSSASAPSPSSPLLAGTPIPPEERESSLRPSTFAATLAVAAQGTRHAIGYHGGQVVDHPITVYYLWYGNWSSNGVEIPIVEEFTRHLGGSPWWSINAAYADARGARPSDSITMGKSAFDTYSQGATVSDDEIAAAVVSAIARGALPDDPRGVYMVLGSADVDATSGFCTAYCGFHKVVTMHSSSVSSLSATASQQASPQQPKHRYYGYVGDPRRCGLGCSMQHVGPNGASPADGMVSIIAHELAEVVTDPYADAWYDASGLENADKCIWVFGGDSQTYRAPNGALANVQLGGKDYLLQANWKLDGRGGGRCSMS